MNGKTRRKSDLVVYEKLSPNKGVPRTKTIRRLTPHCVAGNLAMESILALANFQPGGGASTNYAIGGDGRRGLGVEETSRPWTTSSATNDNEAITWEIANNTLSPDWRMTDAAINAWLDMAVEICKFYGYTKVNYREKPANVPLGVEPTEAWIKTWAQPGEMIITLHRWYANKSCPGPYFVRQIPWLVGEINKRLQNPGKVPEAFIGECATPPVAPPIAPQTPSDGGFAPYMVRITVAALNIRKGPGTNNPIVQTLVNDKNLYTIVGEADGAGAPKWGKLKSGIGWLALNYTARA